MEDAMIRIGLIGCGKIAQVRHIPEYNGNAEAKLYGFYDLNPDRAESLAKQYGGKSYGSYEDLIHDGAIDAVSILTPNVTHAEIAVAALRAGKHVLCEKPMAVTPGDCEKMVLEARASGRILMIAQNQRLTPAHKMAKELLDGGAIGGVISFRTVFSHGGADNWSIDGKNSWFMDKSRSCFGAMADLGIHKTDLMVYLLGKKIVKASAVTGTLDKKGSDGKPVSVDDNAFCTYLMEGGVMGTMTASWTNYGREENTTSLYGTKGAMHIYRNPRYAIEIERQDGSTERLEAGTMQTNDGQTSTGVIDRFIGAIVHGKPSPISAEMVLPAMKAIFACAESAERGGAFVEIDG